jgi:benzoate membrane transport protein
MLNYFRDVNLPAFTAGFVAVLVGFTSSIAIVFQAALAFGASPAVLASWMWAICLGMGLCTAVPSLLLKKPVMVAWSTPGAAVLATTAAAAASLGSPYTMGQAVGAFMLAAALIALFGMTGWFEKFMDRVPMAIAQALLAGVLARFALNAFAAAQDALGMVVSMLLAYLVGKRWVPRYAVPLTLAVGVVFAMLGGQLRFDGAGVFVKRGSEFGTAAFFGDDGFAKPARCSGHPQRGLPAAHFAHHYAHGRSHLRACAFRRLYAQLKRDHRRHRHGQRGA